MKAIRTKIPNEIVTKIFNEYDGVLTKDFSKYLKIDFKDRDSAKVDDFILGSVYNSETLHYEFYIDLVLSKDDEGFMLSRHLTAKEFENCKEKLLDLKLRKEVVIEDLRYVQYNNKGNSLVLF